jgi:hypothetical protein
METALMRYGRVMERGGMFSRLSCRCLTKCKSCNNTLQVKQFRTINLHLSYGF